jgi:aryl-alcohol dehydrogenase-like predicted oxidoreductase
LATAPTRARRSVVGAAAEAGVNFIDTADQYAKGESERVCALSDLRTHCDQRVVLIRVAHRPNKQMLLSVS